MQKLERPTIIAFADKSARLVETLLRGKETGHRVELGADKWEGVGPGQRIRISSRPYKVITPDGRTIEQSWTVVRQGDGITIKPVLGKGKDSYIVLIYKPHPAVGKWLLEFPSGGIRSGETTILAGIRELEEETGFKAQKARVIMQDMHFAPFRFDQRETVVEATDLMQGVRKPDYEEQPIETHLIPQMYLKPLLHHGVITDFRTYSIIAEHLLGSRR